MYFIMCLKSIIILFLSYSYCSATTIINNNATAICRIPGYAYKRNIELCKQLLIIPNIIIPFGNETIVASPTFQNKNTNNITCICPTSSLIQSLLFKNFENPYGIKNKLSNSEMRLNVLKYNICCCKHLFYQYVVMIQERYLATHKYYKLFNIRYSIPFILELSIC